MKKTTLLLLALVPFLAACSINFNFNTTEPIVESEDIEDSIILEDVDVEQEAEVEEILQEHAFNSVQGFDIRVFSDKILSFFKNKNYWEIAHYVHPMKWVRFSPYTYINLDTSHVLFAPEFQTLWNQVILRGHTDGSAFEINLTKAEYFQKWVYSKDFLNAEEVFINQKLVRWNNLNNIDDVFPNSQSIEYYFSWFEDKYEWVDRQSLTLVYEKYNNYYYLVAITHNSWTI